MSNTQFELLRQSSLPSLGADTSYYRHNPSGAEHYHLHMKGSENAFLVAFRTLPENSTGIAHILEHTSLCGSQRFPVRDPFFLMLRRSLSSFMNAMTAADWTAYPFATSCEQDFFNLLEVYLDATFFPLLQAVDFAQEGHRLELEDSADSAGEAKLVIKGVVFNEMKGAMSSPASVLWHGLTKHLCAGTPYQYNSGGDPEVIPQLTHEALVRFHRRSYHPGNAVFMTAGELPPQAIQERIEQLVLQPAAAGNSDKKGSAPLPPSLVPTAPRWRKPRSESDLYPASSGHHHALTAWLLPDNRAPLQRLRTSLMGDLLLGNSSSPLRRKLESCGLGRGLSPVSGLDDSHRESIFACGLKDVAEEDLGRVKDLISDSLVEIAAEGIPQDQMLGAMQQLEFGCREITGDSVPFALELMLDALPALIYGDLPEPELDPSEHLQQLRAEIAQPGFVRGLIEDNLLNNPHTLYYELRADADLAQKRQQLQQQLLRQKQDAMSAEELQAVRQQQQQLADHQAEADDVSLLPKVGLEQVAQELPLPTGEQHHNISLYSAATNGISYLELACPLPALDRTEAALLPLYCACVTGLGSGDLDYSATKTMRARFLGGLSMAPSVVRPMGPDTTADGAPVVWLSLTAKALDRHQQPLVELALAALSQLRLDEHRRIGELRDQMLSARENAIAGNGHQLAVTAAAARFSPQALLAHLSSGLGGLQHLTNLSQGDLRDPAALAKPLRALHDKVLSAGWRAALVAGPKKSDKLYATAEAAGVSTSAGDWSGTALDLPATSDNQGWIWDLPVNYCALSVPIPDRRHPHTAALTVLSSVLQNRWLHSKVREQGGAYGAGATSNANQGSFSFFSYRDPRLAETLDDFRQSMDRLRTTLATDADTAIEEAILGKVSTMDRVGSPAGEALGAFHRTLAGQGNEEVRAFRQRLLRIGAEDLWAAAEHWLQEPLANPDAASAVLAGTGKAEQLRQLGFSLQHLPD